MKSKNRLQAVLLSFALLIGQLGATAYAEEVPPGMGGGYANTIRSITPPAAMRRP